MMDGDALGMAAAACAALAGGIYVKSTLDGKAKPHAVTFAIWGAMMCVVAAGQQAAGGGPGTWATMLGAAFSFAIVALSFKHGEKAISRGDWIVLAAGLGAIPLWMAAKGPLAAVALATAIDALGYAPTFRKAYADPHGEPAIPYLVTNGQNVASMLAMSHASAATEMYPAAMFAINAAMVAMLLARRRSLARGA